MKLIRKSIFALASALMLTACSSDEPFVGDDPNGGSQEGEYKYPHDYPHGWVKQQYLPDPLKAAHYYEPKDSSRYEKALKDQYERLNKFKND